MSLSLKTKVFNKLQSSGQLSLDLLDEKTLLPSGELESFSLNDSPLLLFMKGLGVERIDFATSDMEIIDRWLERVASYELLFLEDPDHFKFS